MTPKDGMKTIVDMANGTVTWVVLKDIPGDPPKMDSHPPCALAKAQHLPFKTGHKYARAPLELIHDDLCRWNPLAVASTDLC